MKITEVVVSIDRKINLGNYEPVGLTTGMTVELEDGEDYKVAYGKAFASCRNILDSEIARYRGNQNGK